MSTKRKYDKVFPEEKGETLGERMLERAKKQAKTYAKETGKIAAANVIDALTQSIERTGKAEVVLTWKQMDVHDFPVNCQDLAKFPVYVEMMKILTENGIDECGIDMDPLTFKPIMETKV
jgi:hypothetical protein